MFEGASNLSLDAKGRVSVPSRVRDVLAESPGPLRVTRHTERCLLIFPLPAWEKFRAKILEAAVKEQWVKRFYLGSAMEVEPDGTGRILISPDLRAGAGITRDVKLVGMGGYLELWDRATYELQEADALPKVMASNAMQDLVF